MVGSILIIFLLDFCFLFYFKSVFAWKGSLRVNKFIQEDILKKKKKKKNNFIPEEMRNIYCSLSVI